MQRRGFFAALAAGLLAPVAAKAAPKYDRIKVKGSTPRRIETFTYTDIKPGTVLNLDGPVEYGPAKDWYFVVNQT
jgi:hypothetical protein